MGAIFKVPAMIVYFVGGLWGLIVCLGIVADAFGWIIAGISLLLFPALMYLAPIYAGLAMENWFPALLVYGSTAAAMALYVVGAKVDGD